MKYFYYTRHGQTIWNVENKICGVSDVSLTERVSIRPGNWAIKFLMRISILMKSFIHLL